MRGMAVFLVLALSSLLAVQGQMGGKKKVLPERRDLPYIACDVCAGAVMNLHKQVTEARAEYGPKSPKGKKMPEEVVSDILDGICRPTEDSGNWIRHLDIVSQAADSQDKKRKLILSPQESSGKCKVECETISKSCYDLMEEEIDDRDDLQAILYVDKKFSKYAGEGGDAKLVDHVCKKMVGRCKSTKTYSTSKYDRVDEEFAPVSDKDLEMEKLMAQMQSMPGMAGQGMNMYDRDDMGDMESMMEGYGYGGYDGMDGYGDMGMGDMGGMGDLGLGGGAEGGMEL
jgi:hypothetical protein